jgi:Tol biopolymer transport system component
MKKIYSLLLFFALMVALHAQGPKKVNTSLLSGKFSAPAGTAITVQNNAKSDLALAAKKESGKTFTTTVFNFPAPVADNEKFKVTVKKTAAGQTCVIYAGAAGTMPQKENTLRIGSDFTYDLVSRGATDASTSTFYESADAAIGGNNGEEGRYVAFVSSAANFAGSTGKRRQIFWRDRNTGITKMISVGAAGEEGNADSYAPAISADGKMVAFESHSANLVPGDKNNLRDIFVWHSATNKIERVSTGEAGQEADGESYEAAFSGDGNFIAFTSTAGNISSTEKGVSTNNVFVRNLKSGSTIMISVDPATRKGGGGSKPSVSYDGARIAFYSHTGTLVADDKNGIWDIFLWEQEKSTLKRISMAADGRERSQGSESANRIVAPAISGNGRYIAFTTTAPGMVAEDVNNFQDVFVYDINTGKTVIASIDAKGNPGNADSPVEQGEKIAISFDGTWVAFSTKASNLGAPASNIIMHNMKTGDNRAISSVTGSNVGRPSMSQTAAYVVFGIGAQLDGRFGSSGIFANYTGVGPCRSCPD